MSLGIGFTGRYRNVCRGERGKKTLRVEMGEIDTEGCEGDIDTEAK